SVLRRAGRGPASGARQGGVDARLLLALRGSAPRACEGAGGRVDAGEARACALGDCGREGRCRPVNSREVCMWWRPVPCLVAALTLVVAVSTACAQTNYKSQLGTVSQQVTDTHIDIRYRRPVARGRDLF